MNLNPSDVKRLIGLKVYARIHDSLGSEVVLIKDPQEGYLYRGSVIGKVEFENGDIEEHLVLALTRPISHLSAISKEHQIDRVLATIRYKGDSMIGLLEGKEVVASFSTLLDSSLDELNPSNVRRYKKNTYQSEAFIWIGVGELGTGNSVKAYLDEPWDMGGARDRNL